VSLLRQYSGKAPASREAPKAILRRILETNRALAAKLDEIKTS